MFIFFSPAPQSPEDDDKNTNDPFANFPGMQNCSIFRYLKISISLQFDCLFNLTEKSSEEKTNKWKI